MYDSETAAGTKPHAVGIDQREQLTMLQSAYKSCEECASQHPKAATLIGLAAGVAAGAVIGSVLSGGRQRSGGWLDRRSAEQLGQNVYERFSSWLPSALQEKR